MRTPVVVDGRNVWEPSDLRAAGFTYYGVGRVEALGEARLAAVEGTEGRGRAQSRIGRRRLSTVLGAPPGHEAGNALLDADLGE